MRFHWLRNRRGAKTAVILVLITILFVIAFYFAPYYLIFSQKPEKSDAVILIVGPDYRARFREGEQLVREGYAEYLIIPAFNQLLKMDLNRSLGKAISVSAPPERAYETSEDIENTHLEITQAKRIMDGLGFKSAIFVSSPYHMRRIKIIAEKVFPHTANTPTFKLYFVPTRYETPHLNSWLLNIHDLRFVLTEYLKIFWFFIYSNFYRSTA